MRDNQHFARWLVLASLVGVFLLVAGVLFGPWQIDPHAETLIGLFAQPGGVALGYLVGRQRADQDHDATHLGE